MTEDEWLASTDPWPMLRLLEGRVSDRKSRLFAVACCRSVWDNLDSPYCRHAVETVERSTEELAAPEEVALVCKTVGDEMLTNWPTDEKLNFWWAVGGLFHRHGWDAATAVAGALCEPTPALHAMVVHNCHDIFGNPFRPVTAAPSWHTSDVLALASGIYAERAFDRLPILADALEDAGCDNHDILNHLRGDGTHVIGCWALDLVLGKS